MSGSCTWIACTCTGRSAVPVYHTVALPHPCRRAVEIGGKQCGMCWSFSNCKREKALPCNFALGGVVRRPSGRLLSSISIPFIALCSLAQVRLPKVLQLPGLPPHHYHRCGAAAGRLGQADCPLSPGEWRQRVREGLFSASALFCVERKSRLCFASSSAAAMDCLLPAALQGTHHRRWIGLIYACPSHCPLQLQSSSSIGSCGSQLMIAGEKLKVGGGGQGG